MSTAEATAASKSAAGPAAMSEAAGLGGPAVRPTPSGRVYNFSAGPGALPEDVLRQAQAELWDIAGTGMGIAEHSHRGPLFDRLLAEAEADFRAIGGVPPEYKVLFLTGGATTQNFQVPANILPDQGVAAFLTTGYWAERSWEESKVYTARAYEAWDGRPTRHAFCPSDGQISYRERPVYVHMCSNNTIYGTQWREPDGSIRYPGTPAGVPLVCDMCSDIYSRPVDFRRFGIVYAGAQKNLGAAGVTIVVVREDLTRPVRTLPSLMRYDVQAREQSRPNTPPVFAIYLSGLVFKWILRQGGLPAMFRHNQEKAGVVYAALDRHAGFFRGHARPDSRSLMNAVFRTPSEALDKAFVEEAAAAGLQYLAGHRATGGIRASLYNAMPRAGAEALASFMDDFARRKG